MKMPMMPVREEGDGEVGVHRVNGKIQVTVTTNGETQSVLMSEYNAWRIFGMLSVMVGLSLPSVIAKAIKLG
jgi:hypothetical protein